MADGLQSQVKAGCGMTEFQSDHWCNGDGGPIIDDAAWSR